MSRALVREICICCFDNPPAITSFRRKLLHGSCLLGFQIGSPKLIAFPIDFPSIQCRKRPPDSMRPSHQGPDTLRADDTLVFRLGSGWFSKTNSVREGTHEDPCPKLGFGPQQYPGVQAVFARHVIVNTFQRIIARV